MRQIKTIHFIGIGGVGMSGIAEVLVNLGYSVTGSDQQKNSFTQRLTDLGVRITYSHIAENVAQCDVVVVSSAIDVNNIELVTARSRRIPIVPRAEMLAELMRFKQGIAVAGTHGKTTTTSLLATIFAAAELDPTFVVGGQINSFGYNAQLGQGEYFIAEADESDASFLHLNPMVSVVTNIDQDHLEAYDNDFSKLQKAFVEFIHRIPFYGLTVLCIDDQNIKKIIPELSRPYLTYGFSEKADIKAYDWQPVGRGSSFMLKVQGREPIAVKLNIPGKHNVLNSLAAIAVALDAGIAIDTILQALEKFAGVGRRMQLIGEFEVKDKIFNLVDDYGHHPQEIKAVIAALRESWPDQRLVMIYQPHRYTRTKTLFDDFSDVLSNVDALLLLDVYSAGEEVIPGIDSKKLCSSIRERGKVEPIYVGTTSKLIEILPNIIQDRDVIITQGAGDIGKISKKIAMQMQEIMA